MFRTIMKCWSALAPIERKQGLIVVFLMLLASVFDIVGVGSIGPFMAVLANPEAIENIGPLFWLYQHSNVGSPQDFIYMIGAITALVLIVTSLFRAAVVYVTIRFNNMHRHNLSSRLLEGNLRQPYDFFIKRNTTELAKTILSETDIYISEVLRPTSQVISYGILAVAILIFLIFLEPTVAFVAIGTAGFVYVAFWGVSRNWLSQNGSLRTEANTTRYKIASEALSGIKELRLSGGEQAYLSVFARASKKYSEALASAQAISSLPRFFVQGSAFAAIIGLSLSLLAQGKEIDQILPIIGMYAFAGYRLLPAMQNVYHGITQLRFGNASADVIWRELKNIPDSQVEERRKMPSRIHLERGIHLENVHFSYPDNDRPALYVENLSILAKSVVGIIGPTGSGKSTLVDVVLGLLRPEKGSIKIDATILNESTETAWQRNIGYVPQQIFLADDTILHNISFGNTKQETDMAMIEAAATSAQLHQFVVDRLPQGYETVVGDKGIRLSGGQRQRIGIARALYNQPEVLVFDEATSALDMETETAVMEAVHALAGERTIIMIAHRLETLRNCDMIIELKDGQILQTGSYLDVVEARTKGSVEKAETW